MKHPPRLRIPEIPAHEEDSDSQSDSDSRSSDEGGLMEGKKSLDAKDKGKKRKDKLPLQWEVWKEEADRWMDANETISLDLDYEDEQLEETAEASPDLVVPLLSYQKEWLAWALKQEESEYRGGILADEMGMGKTIQAIALVLAKRAINQTHSESFPLLPEIKCTLVICPVVAIRQWEEEIAKSTLEGSIKLFVYYGSERKSHNHFSEYDFVLTTYPTLEVEYRKSMMPSKKGNKVVKEDQEISILHSVKWNRIILDEAHSIKNRCSKTAKAVLALESSYKWALSATPVQNNVRELFSLVRFLKVFPYSYFFCKLCDCKLLDSRQCSTCNHGPKNHFRWWRKFVPAPGHCFKDDDMKRRALILLKHKILKSVVLRRTKKDKIADLALPPRTVTLRLDKLDSEEKDFYEALFGRFRTEFYGFVEAGTLAYNHTHITQRLVQLRQAVNHPYLVRLSKITTLTCRSNIENDEEECSICHDPAEDPLVTSCKHVFCKACLTEYFRGRQVSCPSCSKPLTADITAKMKPGDQGIKTPIKGFRCSSIINRIKNLENFHTSTKIDALKEEIRFMIEKDGSAKGIVFSQFVQFLDLIHYSLQKSGICCVQLMGSMTTAARDAAIRRFTDDPDCRIFLLNLKTGGVALNLTVASHVFLMDPWWNPAVERQAQDRIHRIGQYKPIRIVRFITQNTIEEKILKLQEKKQGLFEVTIGGSSDAPVEIEDTDLYFLFNPEIQYY